MNTLYESMHLLSKDCKTGIAPLLSQGIAVEHECAAVKSCEGVYDEGFGHSENSALLARLRAM